MSEEDKAKEESRRRKIDREYLDAAFRDTGITDPEELRRLYEGQNEIRVFFWSKTNYSIKNNINDYTSRNRNNRHKHYNARNEKGFRTKNRKTKGIWRLEYVSSYFIEWRKNGK